MAQNPTDSATGETPSKTAQLVAAVRADVVKYYDNPPYLDELAIHFAGPFWRAVLANGLVRWIVVKKILSKVAPTSPVVVLRALFGEEQIPHALDAGIRQYVILGAGYDTFAMRREDLLDTLTIYELDQKATQEEKFRRMAKANIPRPRNTRYVQADLEREDMCDVLAEAGFDFDQPAVFAWFGVTYYLSHEAIRETLQTIATRMAPGSYVMFDYLSDPAFTPDDWKIIQEKSAAFVAKRGEPWIASFDPTNLESYLHDLGYHDFEHLGPQDVGPRYLAGRTDVLYPEFMGMCRAITRGA